MLKIAVLVSGGGTNLQALIDARESAQIKNGNINLVVASRADAYALTRAEKANIPTRVLLRKNFDSAEAYSEGLADLLQENEIDLVVLAGFMTVISDTFVKQFENRIINIHPSLIPAFCGKGFYGLKVHEEALARGVKLTGATAHFVNEICDGGPIILQKAVTVQENDTAETLQKRVMQEAEWEILPKAVSLFCEGRLSVSAGKVKITEKGEQACNH
ncbi:phosphoribosylglycinamide formyltransferase [Scatolibacter rhodanostii]|uniref:phosphoribosylglycinamide formyltransferase n=1 Tax=Scatolibacter rhodanostii TaxID=2014781 RepID=UPI000C079557|nr:phosphoribosylglycinamide formyltransferase [Scatolibacter rhodanostii]